MKKILVLISGIIILISSILLCDRHAHIDYDNFFYENHIEVKDGLFFDAPKGKWLDLSDEMTFNLTQVFVDEYNHFLCTWKNSHNMHTLWTYTVEKGGQPYPLTIIEKDIYDRRTYGKPVDYNYYYGEVDGCEISYDYLHDHIYIKIDSKTKTIELDMYKEHKDILNKTVLKAINVLKD